MQVLRAAHLFDGVSAKLVERPLVFLEDGRITAVEGSREPLEQMHRAGVRLTAGSDAGVAPGKPFDVMPYGIRFLAQSGLSHVEALRATTSVAAAACGVAGRKGALAPGMDADILAVGGAPLADLGSLLDVRAVFRAGRRVR